MSPINKSLREEVSLTLSEVYDNCVCSSFAVCQTPTTYFCFFSRQRKFKSKFETAKMGRHE